MANKIVNLDSFCEGGFTEKINGAIQEVLENIADLNTDYKAARKVTVDLKFTTTEEREVINVEITTKAKLAPKKNITTNIVMDKDGNGGIIAAEINKQIPGQTYIKVDEETGEVINPAPEMTDVDLTGIKLVK